MAAPPIRPDGKLESTVTYLEMHAPPAGAPLAAPRPDLAVMRAHAPPFAFYRFLYDTVGATWLWGDRRKLAPAALAAVVQHPDVHVHVLYAAGSPAGYLELDHRQRPDVEVAYFGLMPDFLGQRLGPWLLDWGVREAFQRGAGRLWVHTCTLDHPAALALYERAGFHAYKREIEVVDDPRVIGVIP